MVSNMNTKDDSNSHFVGRQGPDGFIDRLRYAMSGASQADVSRKAGLPKSNVSSYFSGKFPSFEAIVALARALNVDPVWLGIGEGFIHPDHDSAPIMVPKYDVKLAAGAGSWSDRAVKLGTLAFPRAYLEKIGAPGGIGLVVLGVGGDSMAPTLRDGADVVVQTRVSTWSDGIWAFAQDDVLRIKRLQRGLSKLTIISDNPQYAVEELPLEEADTLQLIGKCLWGGQSL
jgi:phage repressor protein C with HTH and peptisase S24 domain